MKHRIQILIAFAIVTSLSFAFATVESQQDQGVTTPNGSPTVDQTRPVGGFLADEIVR